LRLSKFFSYGAIFQLLSTKPNFVFTRTAVEIERGCTIRV